MLKIEPKGYGDLSTKERAELRDRYQRAQGGRCYYCQGLLNKPPTRPALLIFMSRNWTKYPPTFFANRVHLHHDQDTGLTIGAVHSNCNAVLMEFHNE